MRALEELPTATKNLIFPIVRIRPWLNSKSLLRSTERLDEAFGNRYFGLDLDAILRGQKDTVAYAEFEELFDQEAGWKNYYGFVRAHPFSVPVLRTSGDLQLDLQLSNVCEIDRGLVVRVDVQSPISLNLIAETILQNRIENVVFVFDCGWRERLLQVQAACVGLIKSVASVSTEFEFVAGGGDFPLKGFDNKGPQFSIPGEERDLVQAIRREINEVEVIFGDWASAREPKVEKAIMRSRPRLDMPTRTGWDCWRSPTNAGTYQDLAIRASQARQLGQMSDLWGEQMIIATRDGSEPAIKGPTTAAAVRINLHMILQAHYDAGGPPVGDELVTDEL